MSDLTKIKITLNNNVLRTINKYLRLLKKEGKEINKKDFIIDILSEIVADEDEEGKIIVPLKQTIAIELPKELNDEIEYRQALIRDEVETVVTKTMWVNYMIEKWLIDNDIAHICENEVDYLPDLKVPFLITN